MLRSEMAIATRMKKEELDQFKKEFPTSSNLMELERVFAYSKYGWKKPHCAPLDYGRM